MSYLLDTCLISETVKRRPNPSVVAWLERQHDASLFLSVIVLGELHKGIAKLAPGDRRRRLTDWVDRDLADRFGGHLLGVDAEVAAWWGRLQGRSEAQGAPLPVVDSLIAATASVHHLTVVTRNTADFLRCDVAVFNPWEAT